MTGPVERLREAAEKYLDHSLPDTFHESWGRKLYLALDALSPDAARRADRAAVYRALLEEWLDTPFFESHGEWLEWVDVFRPRVRAALAQEAGE